MRLLIMGPPGAGKGTQAKDLAKRYKIPAISTGDIFRANIRDKTDLGVRVQKIIEAGEYVPDELTEEIVAKRLEEPDAVGGFLLDGFPRTMHQVEALDEILETRNQPLDAVINLQVTPDILAERLTKRSQEESRADDNAETVRNRMAIYERETAPLLDHYRDAGLIIDVDGAGSVDEVGDRIVEAIEQKTSER